MAQDRLRVAARTAPIAAHGWTAEVERRSAMIRPCSVSLSARARIRGRRDWSSWPWEVGAKSCCTSDESNSLPDGTDAQWATGTSLHNAEVVLDILACESARMQW